MITEFLVDAFPSLVAIGALVVSLAALRATREAPLVAEAMKRHTEQVSNRVGEWKNLLPVAPEKDEAHHYSKNDSRKNTLQEDWLYRDVVENHWVGDRTEWNDLWARAIELEDEWTENLEVIVDGLVDFLENQFELQEPPLIEVVDANGEIYHERDSFAIDVFWPGFLDLLVAELLTGRISKGFENSRAHWWTPPVSWSRSEKHTRRGLEEGELPFDLDWVADKNSTTLATVNPGDERISTYFFHSETIGMLHEEFKEATTNLTDIHDEMDQIEEEMKKKLEKLQAAPLLSGPKCPYVTGLLDEP